MWVLFVLSFIGMLVLTGYVADVKDRNPLNWIALAVVLGPLALIALAGLPPLRLGEDLAPEPEVTGRPWNPALGTPPSDW